MYFLSRITTIYTISQSRVEQSVLLEDHLTNILQSTSTSMSKDLLNVKMVGTVKAMLMISHIIRLSFFINMADLLYKLDKSVEICKMYTGQHYNS